MFIVFLFVDTYTMKNKVAEGLTLFLMVIVCPVIIIFTMTYSDMSFAPNKMEYHQIQFHSNHLRRFEQTPQPSSCHQNTSVYNLTDFGTLPAHVKNFLLYRHCRTFPLLLDAPDKCGGPRHSADVFLLLVIKSSPQNYERREVLRKTWAEEKLHNGVLIRRIFITGTTGSGFEKRRLNRLLKDENDHNEDILQWDFDDSFYNLTLKQVLFLEWMERKCPHVRFLLNGDDDIFANTFNMIEYLQGLEENDGSKHLFTGFLFVNTGPSRDSSNKYYVPVQVQQSDIYPPYCGGGGFLLSGFTARTIYKMSHSIELHPIDDAYMGMCLEKAGLMPTSHFGVRTIGLDVPGNDLDIFDPCYYREIILVHRFLPHMIYVMWGEIQDPYLRCGNTNSSVQESQ
ncbi:hypothetical protein DNTS_024628 [Danionella cerebrum]|uniref:Hexosyltransferase n=1 Tax=Danionella cerebrum TaxID=2873325 RepID=A0A553NHM7_9TELE|nr:hypothetical protein DNTS_024628 [Danionella translucida]